MCADNSIVSKKLNKIFWPDLERLPICKALCRADPEQNAGTINKSNPEHMGIIHESNLEHLLVLKAPRGDNSRVQSGTPPCF